MKKVLLIAILFFACSTDQVDEQLQTKAVTDQYSVPFSECEAYTLPSNLSYDRIIDRFDGTGEDAGNQYNSPTRVIVAYGSELGGSIAIANLLRGDYVDVRYSCELYKDGELIETFCVTPGYWVAFHRINLKPKGKPGTVEDYVLRFPDYNRDFSFSVTKQSKSEEGCSPHCLGDPHNSNCWVIRADGTIKHCIIPPHCNDKDQ